MILQWTQITQDAPKSYNSNKTNKETDSQNEIFLNQESS